MSVCLLFTVSWQGNPIGEEKSADGRPLASEYNIWYSINLPFLQLHFKQAPSLSLVKVHPFSQMGAELSQLFVLSAPFDDDDVLCASLH